MNLKNILWSLSGSLQDVEFDYAFRILERSLRMSQRGREREENTKSRMKKVE